ncbi:MAG TPA: DnaJ family domain-containing protein [Casimicrobiaceae bacterium]|nr:DnaJ family domain-containing protein [Casimicrobiaceae bacterium]
MTHRSKRDQALRTLDEEIGRRIEEASASGELEAARSYGKPFATDEGWDATPEALRMPMKILKDAGVVPLEIALFHERARLRALLDAASNAEEAAKLRAQLTALEQMIALRLEALRVNSTL